MKVLTLLCLVVLAVGVICQKDPNLVPGSAHGVMVHLFEWKFQDIAAECERFLGPNGFGAVQVSPIHENLIVTSPFRPWWERYQVVSYNLISRSGDEAAFRDMVNRCNNAGVRIYVDVVLNQMTGSFANARGQAGNVAYPDSFQYPGVPYGPLDFHNPTCGISTTDYSNSAANVRNCELNGLHDLNQTSPYVRNMMINYLNHLVDCGIAGFRVDAAKHMWPADLEYIYSKVNDLSTSHGFSSGSRPFFYQEAIDLGTEAIKSTEYTDFGRVMEFRYSRDIGNAFRGGNAIKYLKNFGEGWGYVPSGDAVSFVDNHDNQRGHGAGGPSILTYKDAKLYKMAVAFMLGYTYGFPRVMSSFYFENTDQGPPADSNGNIISPAINAQGTCDNGWVCEHRWRQVYNMVAFRNVVEGNSVTNWWDNGNKQIAFGRGCKGFIAFNNEFGQDLKQTLPTCLPSGVYCDVISGSLQNGACTGKKVTVQSDGKAYIEILNSENDGVLAIHVQSKQS